MMRTVTVIESVWRARSSARPCLVRLRRSGALAPLARLMLPLAIFNGAFLRVRAELEKMAATLALPVAVAGTVAVMLTVQGLAVALEQLAFAGSVTELPLVLAVLPVAATVVVGAPPLVVLAPPPVPVPEVALAAVPALVAVAVEDVEPVPIGVPSGTIAWLTENSLVTPGSPPAGTVVAVEET